MAYVKCIRNLISSTVPDGKTVTPTDDISIWLACGGRSETYTTLSQVLADSTCLSALINDNNAVDYLVRSTTWASGITADSSAMSYIGLNNYASNTLLADSTWQSAICNSPYFESVLNVKVPTMTSNTTPSGECYFDGSIHSGSAYNAFDGDDSTMIQMSGHANTVGYSRYRFENPIKVYRAYAKVQTTNGTYNYGEISGSNDGSTWNVLDDSMKTGLENTFTFDNLSAYSQYRAKIFCNGGTQYTGFFTLQFYGRVDI